MESIENAPSLPSAYLEEFHARKIPQELWRQCVLSPYINKSTAKEVEISTVDGDVMQSLVKYCYNERTTVTDDIVVKLLENTNEPILSDFIPARANSFVDQLNPSYGLGFKVLAEQSDCDKLLQKARDYSLEHFMQVQEMDEFLRLNAKQLKELSAYGNPNVFNSLLAWIRHDPIERAKHQAELLKVVRLPLLETTFLKQHARPIWTSMGPQEMYVDALEIHLSPHYLKPNVIKSIKSGKSNQLLMGITAKGPKLQLGYSYDQPKIQIHYHCPQRLQWMKCSKQLEYRLGFGIAVMEDNLFLLGGYQNYFNTFNTVVCLNLKTMNLKEISPMLEHRKYCGAAVLNGFLYAVGGINNGSLNSAEKWNPKTNTWSRVRPMLKNRFDFDLVVLNKRLYAVGGVTGENTGEFYDQQQNKWLSIASMHHSLYIFGVTVCNGLLYAVGGDVNIKTVERYIPEFDSWTVLCSLNDSIVYPVSCITFRDKVIVCYEDRVEEYNEETDEWKISATLKGCNEQTNILTYSGELLKSAFVDN